MKSFLRYIFFISIITMVSCNDDYEIKNETSKVAFSVTTRNNVVNEDIKDSRRLSSSFSSSTNNKYNTLKRDAPIGVSGVNIIATHQVENIETKGIFSFDGDGEPFFMDIPVGINKFSATSISNYQAESAVYSDIEEYESSLSWWDYPTQQEMNDDKIEYYSNKLEEKHPVYALYLGNVTKDIEPRNYVGVNIPMITQSARFNIVIETSSRYAIAMLVTYNLNGVKKTLRVDSYNVSAMVLNDKELKGNIELDIKLYIYKYKRGSYRYSKMIRVYDNDRHRIKYKTKASLNKTLVISYKI